MDAREAPQLVLDWDDRQWLLGDEDQILLGSADAVDLGVAGESTSRFHARIERRKNCYVLIDHSTNGTFIQTEDEQVTFLRRAEMRLWGDGWIALGQRPSIESAIRFQHT